MYKSAFSFIEIIISILIIAIITQIAYSNFFNVINKTNIVKIKSEASSINNAINKIYSNQVLLGNESFALTKLDNALTNQENEILFDGYNDYKLFDNKIYSTNESSKKLGSWIKESNEKYKVYISNDQFLRFEFEIDEATFSCKEPKDLCKEVSF